MRKVSPPIPVKKDEPLIGYQNYQSGPFAMIPVDPTNVMLGWGSKIKIGLLQFDFSFNTFSIPFATQAFGIKYAMFCEILFEDKDGIPTSAQISLKEYVENSITYAETEYHDPNGPRSPKNIKKVKFPVGEILPFNENLQNEYGDSIVLGPRYQENERPLWVGLRTLYTAIQLVQTCYGFLVIPSP